ncbi:MAG: hypothetical protein K6G24_11310 [Lachnospiraceae bacterium]|nr:hypothetical protein [Lachnospiraceae bacterium]
MITQTVVDDVRTDANQFIKNLKSMPPEEAKRVAKDMLKRIGALDENGNPKEQIVTGDFFGW